MKRSLLKLSAHQTVESSRDFNGRFYIAYSKGASVFIRDAKALRQFLKVPKSIPMRETLDDWLADLDAADQKRHTPKEEGLSEELLATGFGPEIHALDESDPNFQTRMVT